MSSAVALRRAASLSTMVSNWGPLLVPVFEPQSKSSLLHGRRLTHLNARGNRSEPSTLAIKTGVLTPHLGVGCVFGDSESYETFKELYDPVIDGWHGFGASDSHRSDMDYAKLTGMNHLDDNYIKSTRVRAGRSVSGLARKRPGRETAGREKIQLTRCQRA